MTAEEFVARHAGGDHATLHDQVNQADYERMLERLTEFRGGTRSQTGESTGAAPTVASSTHIEPPAADR